MPKLKIVDRWRQSGVDYDRGEIKVGRFAGRLSSEVIGHEYAHYKKGHKYSEDILIAFQQELEAWDDALERAPEGEWNRLLVKTAMEDYADEIYDTYGEEMGNEALRKINELLRKHYRKFE